MNTLSLLALAIVFLQTGCAYVQYQVSARTDPFFKTDIKPSSFVFQSDTTNADPLIEKNIHFLISSSLQKKGWSLKPVDEAEYVFSVKYSMTDKQDISSYEVGGYYDRNTKKWVQGVERTETDYVHERVVTIFVSKAENTRDYVWSATCTSRGSTQDLLFAAQYMVPFAMQKFPEEGIWKEREPTK